ncbi:hypothetical protein GCM10010495_34430 [Kitasatospora herbaricolor]|uniref:hypothetical protein n=1 Tax=Kitasatospora herbaricolor TaxID=68217 RepID=UPI00174AFC12|nr:hypothetical protein [Kitasatospora herbaricolor]MDQ0309987.1 hypothetical protein [Kitasatospora herbaricolor]GGV17245.1 hypothetical protein GCM10010495_34430 [Kitasatospora herbaricolor]
MPLSDDQPHTRTRLPVAEQSSYQPNGRQARPVRTLLTVLVVVTLLVLAISVANRGKADPDPAAPPSADRAAASAAPGGAGPGPSGEQPVSTTSNGIANGFPHTDQGAQSAAANYAVAIGSAEMFRTEARHTIVATIADPAALAGLQGRLDQGFGGDTAARYGLDAQGKAPKGLTFVSRTVPVGTKSVSHTESDAKVEVWSTGLTGLAGERSTLPVVQNWYTLTLSLRWTGGDWKLVDFTSRQGPAPVPGDQQAATAEEITGAVQQFGGFRYAR